MHEFTQYVTTTEFTGDAVVVKKYYFERPVFVVEGTEFIMVRGMEPVSQYRIPYSKITIRKGNHG